MLISCLIISGCGEDSKVPSAKEQITKLHDTYAGEKGKLKTQWIKARKDNLKGKPWQVVPLPDKVKYAEQYCAAFPGVLQKLKNEKVSKDVEQYKAVLIKKIETNQTYQEYNKSFLAAIRDKKPKSELQSMNKTLGEKYKANIATKYEELKMYEKAVLGQEPIIANVTKDNQVKIYKAYLISGVVMSIYDNYQTYEIKRKYSTTKALGKFVIVDMAIKNSQKDAIFIDSSSFKLVDGQNREFSTSSHGMTAVQIANGDTKGFLTQLNPGMSTTFTFVFDVPADMDLAEFSLQARGGMSGEKVLMNIMPERLQ